MAYKNPEDQKKASKRCYERNKPHHASVKKLRLRKKKETLLKMFGGCCIKCGYSKCTGALEFHHQDSTEKGFCISARIYWPMDKLIEEAKKCIILCKNCHAEEHFTE